MSEARRSSALSSRIRRRIEQTGVLLFLAAIAFLLWRCQDLIAWSDPAAWYDFGRHFREGFGRTPLAPGFPFAVNGAVALVGPLWAYLINLPLLLLLAGLVYALARCLVPPEPHARLGAFAGGVAVALLVARNHATLLQLSSPYSDPLAYVLSLIACLLLLRYARAASPSPAWLAASAASLALACSTGGTSALLLAPFGLYLWLSRRRLAATRDLAIFAGVFALFCLPMALHMLRAAPGIETARGPGTLPELLQELWQPQGWTTAGLLLLGLASAVRQRRLEVLALCAPAALLYLIFCAWQHAVAREFLAVDLFALPVAAAGAAGVLQLALAPLGAGRAGRVLAVVAGAAACVGAAGVAVGAARPPEVAFRIEDARALRNHVEALVGDAPVFAERALAGILRAFLSRSERVHTLTETLVSDASVGRELGDAAREAGEAYLVYQTTPLKPLVRSHFDFQLLASFPSSSYGLAKRAFMQPRFHVDRLSPWNALESERSLLAREPGRHLLAVDVGGLSALERSHARLRWNERELDRKPRDGINTYVVRVDDASTPGRVMLDSDAPVPAWLGAELVPLARPLVMSFDPAARLSYQSRLSPDFFTAPSLPLPSFEEKGYVDVPTPEWHNTLFIGVADLEVEGGPVDDRVLTIGVEGHAFHRVALQAEEPNPGQSYGTRVSFAFLPFLVKRDSVRLSLEYGGGSQRGRLALRSLALHRHELAPSVEVDVGRNDGRFVMDGFLPPRSAGSSPQSYRWTEARAEMRLPVAADARPARLSVRYYEAPRAAGARAPDPVFKLNRTVLQGERERRREGDLDRVTATFPVAQARLRLVNHLVIRSAGREGRGVMLDRVSLERIDDGRG